MRTPFVSTSLLNSIFSGNATRAVLGAALLAWSHGLATAAPDTTPPTILSVVGSPSFTEATVNFSEALLPPTATNLPNYSFSAPALVITAAKLGSDGKSVVLTTTQQTPGVTYTLIVTGVRDNALNVIAPGTKATFTPQVSLVYMQGFLVREVYTGITGTTISNLTNNAKFPNSPDAVSLIRLFETPDSGDNYGERVSGFLTPPETGDYIFYVCSDDNSTLFLSTDESPANKRQIAFEPQWNNARQWLVTTRRNATNAENRSVAIRLESGKRYYVEALMKEGGGGDNLGVTWKLPSQANPPANGSPGIGLEFISVAANPIGASINITGQPQNVTVTEGTTPTVTFSVAARGITQTSTNAPIFYQWQRNGTDMAGANSSSYVAQATVSNSGSKYRVAITTLGAQAVSQEATLTITPDTTAPTLVSANTYTRPDKVTVVFSEPVSDASAAKTANYAVNSGVTVTGAAKTSANTVELNVITAAAVTPPPVFAPPAPPPAPPVTTQEITLLSINDKQMWRYENNGLTNLGTAWKDKIYNDSAWPQGPALLALESGTTVEPIRTPLKRQNAAGQGIMADYFRTHFTFAGDPKTAKLQARYVVDDGLLVYLNGTEVHRFSMPTGAVTPTTAATSHEGRSLYEGPFELPTAALVAGDNVLAVEVHQTDPGSSDIVFGLELKAVITGATATPPAPLMEFNFNEGTGSTVVSTDGKLAGTFVGTPSFSTDTPSGLKGDYALQFAAGQRVTVPDPTKVLTLTTNNTSFTIQAWLKFATPAARSVFFYNNGPGGAVSASVFTNRTAFVTTLGIVDQRSSAVIPDDGGWHHMAVVHDFVAKQFRFYVDGTLGATVTNYTRGVIFTRTNQVFYIGSEPTGGLQYVGLLDRLRYTAAALAPSDLDSTRVPATGVQPPAPLAYDGFDYAAGELPGKAGGTGWTAAWQTNNSPAGSSLVQAGSLSYMDGNGNVLVSSGGKGFVTGVSGTAQPFREIPTVLTNNGTTAWFSFLGARTGPTTNITATPNNIYPRAANVSLFNSRLTSSSEQLALGGSTGAPENTWALLPDGSLNNRQGSTAPFDQVSFVVVRIDFKDGNDDAYLWVNPALDSEPSTASAAARSIGRFDYSFNRIRPFAGNPQANNSRPHAEMLYDELRVGVNYSSVAPYTQAAPGAERVLVAIDAVHKWRYENTGKDLGTSWKDPGFNDSAWPQGPALLAAETGATAEPIRTRLVRSFGGQGIITDYFRTHFTISGDPKLTRLSLRHVVDDSVVVYLNGVEVHRFGVPANQNSRTAGANHENRYEGPFEIPATALAVGDNVLAAEVHNQAADSSDMVFGLELKASKATLLEPEGYRIGLNFGANEANGSLTNKVVAGVGSVAQANWNNLTGANGTNTTVAADIGGTSYPTPVRVQWNSSGTWASSGRGEENNRFPTNSADRVLMTGYLDTGNTTTTSVSLTNLPSQLTTAGYDLYVYAHGGVSARGGGYRILDGATRAVLRDYVLAQAQANPTGFVQVPILPVPQYGPGNYLIFRGLTASSIIIEATTVVPFGFGSTPRAPINAVQLMGPTKTTIYPPAGPLPATGLQLTVTGVQDLAEKPNTISADAKIVVNTDAALPLDFGQFLNAYQDEFSGTTLNPNWKARGPSTNIYSLTNGYLRVVTAGGDPNHLLYERSGYNPTNQEVLARIRIAAFGTGDPPRAGIGVGVSTNSQGMNLHFRDLNQNAGGVSINGRHVRLLDDNRAWGPGFDFRPVGANRWVTNTWYWLRLRQQVDLASGRADAFGKAWLADGLTPEPVDWQTSWDRYPADTVRSGFAGITASSLNGVSIFDVDYILIKAPGLNTIQAGGSDVSPRTALLVTGATPSVGDAVVSTVLASVGYKVTSVTAPASRTSDATGKAVIVISSTVNSGDMLSGGVHKFRDTAVPLLNWESASYDDLGMTGTASTEFGTSANMAGINIVNPSHPLAGGVPAGTNAVFLSPQTVTWGVPLANAIVVARPVDNAARAVIFGYEQGDE
ncbi:MAG: hypothetical protein HY735_02905, partial [Verrucomicrobia bacterium]|nr:hypothetical protein [Verrucomicrobiota bacterium]